MPISPFSVEVRGDADIAMIVLRGDINADAEPDMSRAYAQVAGGAAPVLVLDFSRADYINSTGITLIVALLGDARRDGREVRAFGLSPHYQEIFQITRLSDYMHIFEDAASANIAAAPSIAGGQP
jgi:anti-anti-sigma factor